MKFDDEPVPGYPLPILAGHTSPGRLERVLRAGQFAVTAEIEPPDSADAAEVVRRAAVFDGRADALNATDGSGANCHMSSMAVCAILTRAGYAPVMQISCRDKNRIAIQGDILGGAAMGVCNMMMITGDGVQAGDHPQAKPVFDLDCMSLLTIAKTMRDQAHFQSGRKITATPKVFLGAAANPFAPPYDWRALRTIKKIQAGAQFIQTQYCYDMALLKNWLNVLDGEGYLDQVFILVGVGPIRSAKVGEWMRNNVPGVHIPDAVIARMKGAENQLDEGRKICQEFVEEIKALKNVNKGSGGVSGIHMMAYRLEEVGARIIEDSGVLAGRTPWYPGRDAATSS